MRLQLVSAGPKAVQKEIAVEDEEYLEMSPWIQIKLNEEKPIIF